MPTERELKYLLDSTAYSKLLRLLRSYPVQVIKQENHYFDTDKLRLKKNNIGLRLRFSNGKKPTLTVKQSNRSKKNIAAYSTRLEIEAPLSGPKSQQLIKTPNSIWQLSTPPVQYLRRRIGTPSLQHVGKLTTWRRKIRWTKKTLLELDRYKINGKSFYELECETSKPHQTDKEISDWLKQRNIVFTAGGPSKLKRFFSLIPSLEKQRMKQPRSE